MNKILFLLDILKSVRVDEKEDQSVTLALSLNEMPEDIKAVVFEKMNDESTGTCKGHHLMKELHDAENVNFDINLIISKNREIQKIAFAAFGEQKDELSGSHKMNIDAEISFRW